MSVKIGVNDDNHAKEMLEELNRYRNESKLHCDFTIIAGTEEIPVHKNVISAGSDYFKAMLSHDKNVETQSGRVEIKGVDPVCLKQCIEYIYTGELSTTIENAESLMNVAQFIQLRKVVDGITNSLEENLDENSYFVTMKIANLYGCKILEEKGKIFAMKNFEKISNKEEFKFIEEKDIIDMIKCQDNKASEKMKLKALITWIEHKASDRKKVLKKLDHYVDLQKVPLNYRRFLIEKKKIVKTCLECCHAISMSVMDSMNIVASDSDSFEPENSSTSAGAMLVSQTSSNLPVYKEIVSTVLDHDMFAYMKLVHSWDLNNIK
ncbi:kelch-like protein 12 [Styela clava]